MNGTAPGRLWRALPLWIPLLLLAAGSPTWAITVISQGPNTTITLGVPYGDLEFDNPLTGSETVAGVPVVEWLDGGYSCPGGPSAPPDYEDWTVSPACVNCPSSSSTCVTGYVNEFWLQSLGWTGTTMSTLPSSTVSIHLHGDDNDGPAEVLVDGVQVAVLDMYTPGADNALILVEHLPYSTHTITVTALTSGDVAVMGAAILATSPAGTDCDIVDFEDHPSVSLGSGEVFTTGGVTVTVGDFFFNVGPCGGATTSVGVAIGASADTCGSGQVAAVNNVTLDFDFGGPVTEVVIPYGEYGGTVDLSVNGDCRVVQNFADLHGMAVGGVLVKVVDFGTPGQSCGVISLDGIVNSLIVGGQELFLDNLSYCRPCPTILTSRFEDLPLSSTYTNGAVFTSGDATYEVVTFFFPGPTCMTPFNGGFAQVQAAGLACGTGKELSLNNVNLDVDFGPAVDWIVLSYGEYGGNVNLEINGDCRNFDNFADISGSVVGGVQVWDVALGASGNSCGRLYVSGLIFDFLVGGQELVIDDVHACANPAVAAPEIGIASPTGARGPILHQNAPNPFGTATTIGFELPRYGHVELRVYDVAGRLVRTLADQNMKAGPHALVWDGQDDEKRRISGGVYFYRLATREGSSMRRMVLLN